MHALVSLSPLLFLVSLSLLTTSPPLWSPPPPSSSHFPPIYSSRWVRKSWLFLIVSGNGGPMSLSLSGCSVGSRSGIGTGSHLKEPFGSDIPQGNIAQLRSDTLEQSCSRSWCSRPSKAQVMDQGVWAKVTGPMGLRLSIVACSPGAQHSELRALPWTKG